MGDGGGVKPKDDDSDWTLQTYKDIILDFEMLYEPTISDNEEKEGDNCSGNHLVNPKKLTTSIDKSLVCQQCVQEKFLQIKIGEEKNQKNCISYIEE